MKENWRLSKSQSIYLWLYVWGGDRRVMDSPPESFWTWTKTDSFIHNSWIFLDVLWCLSKSWCFARQKKKRLLLFISPQKCSGWWGCVLFCFFLQEPSSFTISTKIILFSEKISSRHRWTGRVFKTVKSETFFLSSHCTSYFQRGTQRDNSDSWNQRPLRVLPLNVDVEMRL